MIRERNISVKAAKSTARTIFGSELIQIGIDLDLVVLLLLVGATVSKA